ncbi:MAG TPA: tetratricopeptide repeat protein [Actinomycetota bacterium]|nr:tetratricopeptide repeat protein [Actinomycetota bacterium]
MSPDDRPRPGRRNPPRRATGGRRDPASHRRSTSAPPATHSSKGYDPVHLDDELTAELRATARPGKGEILVKVFADAVAAFAAGDLDEAIRLGEQSKHIALRAMAAREFLGLAYYHAGRWQEAQRELAAFRRLSGSNAQNPVLADSYRAMGKPEKAVELCDQMDPRKVEPAAYYEGAIVAAGALADMGRVDEGIERLRKLDLSPPIAEAHHVRAWYVLGDLLERQGRFTQAREWFEAVVSADPESTDASERLRKL